MREIVPIPHSPAAVEGVINLRGKIVAVIHLKKRLGLPLDKNSDPHKMKMIIMDSQSLKIALIVDEVQQVLNIEEKYFEPPSKVLQGVNQEYFKGLITNKEEILILLKPEKILSFEEHQFLQKVQT
jgi:purine-binding chemotaxis protein CheW